MSEEIVEKFIKGCVKTGGELLEQRDGYLCKYGNDFRIKMAKDGSWIKVWEFDLHEKKPVLKLWGVPEDVVLSKALYEKFPRTLGVGIGRKILADMGFPVPSSISIREEEMEERDTMEIKVKGVDEPIFIGGEEIMLIGWISPEYIDPKFRKKLNRA